MAANVRDRSDFTETLAIHAALRAGLKKRLYASDRRVRKTAEKLVDALESEKTIYGRQLKMLTLMQKGATIDAMRRRLRCSRRTIFRYLNHLESAGVDISLEGQRYRVSGKLFKSLLK
jgi:biotin operon repressor